jgi:hypothetical protein
LRAFFDLELVIGDAFDDQAWFVAYLVTSLAASYGGNLPLMILVHA